MRRSLTAIEWARVRVYMATVTRSELVERYGENLTSFHCALGSELSRVADGKRQKAQTTPHNLHPRMVEQALKWCKPESESAADNTQNDPRPGAGVRPG